MARAPRIIDPFGFYHVFSRGNRKQDIFLRPSDCLAFISDLSELRSEYEIGIAAYCLMPNHFHLLLRDPRENLSRFMHRMLTRFVGRFNREHGYYGHVLQGRFKSKPCRSDRYVRVVTRYIDLNPVRAGYVPNSIDWPWCGYSELRGDGSRDLIERGHYERFFGSDSGRGEAIYSNFLNGKANRLCSLESHGDAVHLLGRDPLEYHDPEWNRLEVLASEIEAREGLSNGVIRRGKRVRSLTPCKREFVRRAWEYGIRSRKIGTFLKCSHTAVGKLLKLHGD